MRLGEASRPRKTAHPVVGGRVAAIVRRVVDGVENEIAMSNAVVVMTKRCPSSIARRRIALVLLSGVIKRSSELEYAGRVRISSAA
jgi:hypothetical protein